MILNPINRAMFELNQCVTLSAFIDDTYPPNDYQFERVAGDQKNRRK
jgi:hypothetical protein